jgi:ABC-type sugar transport system permease subunit
LALISFCFEARFEAGQKCRLEELSEKLRRALSICFNSFHMQVILICLQLIIAIRYAKVLTAASAKSITQVRLAMLLPSATDDVVSDSYLLDFFQAALGVRIS